MRFLWATHRWQSEIIVNTTHPYFIVDKMVDVLIYRVSHTRQSDRAPVEIRGESGPHTLSGDAQQNKCVCAWQTLKFIPKSKLQSDRFRKKVSTHIYFNINRFRFMCFLFFRTVSIACDRIGELGMFLPCSILLRLSP